MIAPIVYRDDAKTPMITLLRDTNAIESYYEKVADKYGGEDKIPAYLKRWLLKAIIRSKEPANH